nr:MAG TPA: dimeris T4 recombination endonuclease VII [Caudoviricetes sp.]
MKRLIAKRPILYLGRMYQEGEALPGGDAKMVDAWVRNKSAEWSGENAKTTQGGQDGTQGTQDGQDGQDGTQDGQDGTQDGTQDGQDGGMIAGHLDPKDLEDLKKADLERMATDMGLEISKAKTKADLIAVITAAEVYAPAKNENGGAQ